VANETFAYLHSAALNNDGTPLILTDQSGRGGLPRCRADDPVEWGANAIFTTENGDLVMSSKIARGLAGP